MASGRIKATATVLRDYLASQVARGHRIADIEDLIDAAIIWAIKQRFPDITTIRHKNEEDFGDNIVWYFGLPGDVAVEMRGSFFQAIDLLQNNDTLTVVQACDLLTQMIKQTEWGAVPTITDIHAPPVAQSLTEDRNPSSSRWITVLMVAAFINAILLFTLVGVLMVHGIILVPAIVSGVVVVAFVSAAIWSSASEPTDV